MENTDQKDVHLSAPSENIKKKKKDSIIQHTAERWRVKRVHIDIL